jgi:phosphoglycolate phosphatase
VVTTGKPFLAASCQEWRTTGQVGQPEMAVDRVVLLFDIDGTLIDTGGAGAASWRLAFDELYGTPADIGKYTDAGMTDSQVARKTFETVVGYAPTHKELSTLLERRLNHLYDTVAASTGYRVLPAVEKLLPRLLDGGYLLGLVTGNGEAAAHIKLHRARLNRFFSFGGYGSDSDDRAQLTRTALERAALIFGAPLEPERCLSVGDTPLDVAAAHQAGIQCVGVATGHFSVEQLQQADADYVLESLEDSLPADHGKQSAHGSGGGDTSATEIPFP